MRIKFVGYVIEFTWRIAVGFVVGEMCMKVRIYLFRGVCFFLFFFRFFRRRCFRIPSASLGVVTPTFKRNLVRMFTLCVGSDGISCHLLPSRVWL